MQKMQNDTSGFAVNLQNEKGQRIFFPILINKCSNNTYFNRIRIRFYLDT